MVKVRGEEMMPQILKFVIYCSCGGYGSPVLETILEMYLSYQAEVLEVLAGCQ